MIMRLTISPPIGLLSLLYSLGAGAMAQLQYADGFMTTISEVGKGRPCVTTPCTLYFKTPAGGDRVRIVVNGFDRGEFPAGEVVDLGAYNERTVRIELPDTEYRTTFITLPVDNK